MKTVAWPFHGLIKTFQHLARGGGLGWGETVLLSYISQEGRDALSEKYCPSNLAPPNSTLPCSGSGGQKQGQHAAEEEKTENTAGN